MQLNGEDLQILEPDKVVVSKKDDVYINVECDKSVSRELVDYFTFEVPGAQFMPQYRNRYWDGKIRLFNSNNTLYYGLVPYLSKFCEQRQYNFVVDESIESAENFSRSEAVDYIDTLGLPFEPRDYQIDAFTYGVRKRRGLLLSPTASGKSLIIYLLVRYHNLKTLIIVPTISLVHQMAGDFKSYGYDMECHKITAGADKISDNDITVSTWQSIYKLDKKWFSQFDLIVGDEAHLFKSKSLTSIMTKLVDCKYRFGLTGTIDDAQTHRLVLEGLFGPLKSIVKTKTLIDKKQLSDFNIKAIVLKYEDDTCKLVKDMKYADEMDFLVRNEQRNKFIKNLSLSLSGNSLVLFQFVEKHGKQLYQLIKDSAEEDREVFFVCGETDAETREQVRAITEASNNAIIIASYGTFSTGINIRSLHNIVFASPSKSRIRNLQSIGRGLRKAEGKETATLIDIADDCSWKKNVNYTLKHFAERIKLYNEENFDYKIYKVKLNGRRIQTPTVI